MKSSIGQNARFVNETLTQLTRLLIPHMVFAILFKISNIHWPVCGYSQYERNRFAVVLAQPLKRFVVHDSF
jgi:hypothetical protein